MLPDLIDLLSYPPTYDGVGGYSPASSPTILNDDPISCRVTVMFGEKFKDRYGFSGPQYRHVYIEPSIAEFENDGAQALALNTNSNASVIKSSEVYRITHMTHQRDEAGNLHHTTVICELADDLTL